MTARIVELPAFTVVGMEYSGNAGDKGFGELWQRFIPREGEIVGKCEPQVSYGLCSLLESGTLHYVAGFRVEPGLAVPEGMLQFEVPAQKYAVFTHKGTAQSIGDSFQAIYSGRLAELGLGPRHGVSFERYDERFIAPDDPASEVDLYIPVC
jgi:AraC family transcriptional regulator